MVTPATIAAFVTIWDNAFYSFASKGLPGILVYFFANNCAFPVPVAVTLLVVAAAVEENETQVKITSLCQRTLLIC